MVGIDFDSVYGEIEGFGLVTNFEKKYYLNQRKRFKELFKLVSCFAKPEMLGLDVGVCPGYFTYCMKRMGYNVVGVDFKPELLNPNIANVVTIDRYDIENELLLYPDNTFDYILFLAVLEHLRINPIKTLKELHRVLKPGGFFIVQTPNLARPVPRLKFLLGRGLLDTPYTTWNKIYEYGYLGHHRLFVMPELVELLQKLGFKIKYKEYLNVPGGGLQRLIGKVIPSCRWNLFVVGEKKE